jgi:hypothetical protein
MSEFVIPSTDRAAALPSRTATGQAWTERLACFSTSGLRVAQLCAREGVSAPSFY